MCEAIRDVDLLELVSLKLLTQLQNAFTKTTGLPSIILSLQGEAKGKWITQPTGCSQLCRAIRSTKGGEAGCLQCDLKHAKEAVERGEQYYVCHCGLVDFCVPLYVTGMPVAAIFGGQMMFKNEISKARQRVLRNASSYLERGRVKQLLGSVKVVDRREFKRLLESAVAMASAISELASERYRSLLLQELTSGMWAAMNLDEMLDRILETSHKAIPDVDSGSISVRLSGTNAFVPRRWIGKFAMGDRFRFRPGEGYIGWVVEHHRPLIVGDATGRGVVGYKYPEIVQARRIGSLLAVPLIAQPQQRLVGVLELSSREKHAFNREQAGLLSAAGQAAASLVQRTFEWETIASIGSKPDPESIITTAVEKIRDLFDGAGCSVFLLDRESHRLVLKASEGLPQNLVGKAWYNLGQGLTGWVAKYGKALRIPAGQKARSAHSLKRLHSDLEWRHRYKEKSPLSRRKMVDRPFLAAPIKDTRGNTVGVLRISDRLTPGDFNSDNMKVLERICEHTGQLLEAADRQRHLQESLLQERLNTVVLSAAGLAHELVSPLSGVIYCLDSLHRFTSERLTRARDECSRIDLSISRLLDLANRPLDQLGESGRQTEVDLTQVVKDALTIVDYQFRVRSIEMGNADISVGPVRVRGDYYSLQMVVLNMLVNAYEAMEELANDRYLRVRVFTRGVEGIIQVLNRGKCIPKEEWESIFHARYTTKKGYIPRGLGLSICRRLIVDVHGGNIKVVSSDPKRGTVFEVSLPLLKKHNSKTR